MRRTNSKEDEEEEEDEVVPVAVTLRNAFAPKQQQLTNRNQNRNRSKRSGNGNGNGKAVNKARPCVGIDINHSNSHNHNQDDDCDNLNLNPEAENDVGSGSESESDTTLDDSLGCSTRSSFPYLSRLSLDQSNLPLQMELAVPHSLLVELKHSYRNFTKMKDKVSEKFGLGKMDHESARSGRNKHNLDGDIHRLVPVCTMPIYESQIAGCSSRRERNQDALHLQKKACSNSNSVIASAIVVGTANHPLWDHIHERLDDLYNEVIAPPNLHQPQHQHQHQYQQNEQNHRERIWNDIKNCMRIQCKAISKTANILTSASLNPKKLKVLPIHANTITSEEPRILGVSKYTNAIPCALPRNSLMIHFSDGSTRVLPALYNCLVKSGIIPNTESDSNGSSWNGSIHDVQVDKFEKRFDDDIFNMLTSSSKSKANANASTVKLNLGSRTPSMNGSHQHVNGKANGTVRGSFTEAFNSLSIHNNVVAPSEDGNVLLKSMELSDDDDYDDDDDDNVDSDESPNYPHSVDEFSDIRGRRRNSGTTVSSGGKDSCDVIKMIHDMDEEIESLQQLLEEEEEALRKEKESQQGQVGLLQDFIAEVTAIDKEILEIDEEANIASNDCVHNESELRSKRRSLLKELKESIFPIRTGDVFTINGIPLPKNMHSLTASDEIISAGLGFVCLVVIMSSKYLSIPLRHHLIFNSSRSAVRENFDVFPLFKERVVEKEQFDRGIILLHRNIDHLLQMRGVPIRERKERTHILAKLELLLDYL